MIEIKNLSCAFGSRTVLDDVSLNIQEHLSILGVNGSGKSTLAKALCGLQSCKGSVYLNGENLQTLSLKSRAQTISYIPAKLDIYDAFISVAEFVLQGRFSHKESFIDYSKKDKKITKETLDFLNISHLGENAVSSLSSGEQQLVLIAQALAQQSEIIIFDEPTANLDPHNAHVIAKHIKGLKEYHQVILITHDLHLAQYVSSPVLFIDDKKAKLYSDDFFEDTTLSKLYGVAFNSLAVKYE